MDPESQELQLRRAGVPWENLFRDIGVSGSTGTQERRGWHRLDNRLAEAEAQWTRYLESIKRRTRDGLERARQQGKVLGPPRKVGPGQLMAMRRMREGGASLRRIASDFECLPSTVLRALRREGVAR